MESVAPLSATEQRDIVALAAYLERHIQATWQDVLVAKHAKLRDAYDRIGEMAYGAYMEWLLRPLRRQITRAGLRLDQHFPGEFNISREWGAQDDRQRWMWSAVTAADGTPLGTLVLTVYHDHTAFRVPRPIEVLGLAETAPDVVVAALSARSPDFAAAPEARVEIAAYLAGLTAADS